ncbi:MAG: GNAT family N-acetyltransferase [Isosphaeraceae bacterium]
MPRIDDRLRIEPCPAGRLEEALRVLYRRIGPGIRPNAVAEALAEFSRGDLDPGGFWIASRNARLIGAMLTQSLAGRAAAVWPPEVEIRLGRGVVASAMVGTVLMELGRRGFRIAQALVDESSPHRAAVDLARGGLPRVTSLHYLGRPTSQVLPTTRDQPELEWSCCTPSNRAVFARTLQKTYRESLDMPELGDVRSLDDILATQQGAGRFDPGRWRIGTRPGDAEPSVVLLMGDQPGRDAWEVTYLGVTPEGRRKGLGMAALRHGLELARPYTTRLELAVDERNGPARRLYARAGFVPFDRRAVHLAILGGGDGAADRS